MIGIALFLLSAQEVKPWDDRPKALPQTKGGYNVELVGWVDSVGSVRDLAASEDGKMIYAATNTDSLTLIDIFTEG